ncbi:MAG: glycosyltransferase family 9 protein [Muribaculaceae bacterium]|nr:glycosyltransferase family 9 protein [Muribaculaceae bacterium]
MSGHKTLSGNVLLARFSAIGDVAMTVPVIYSACACYPRLHFVLLTRASMTSIFACAPENLTVVGVDLKNPAYKGIGGMRRLAAEMRRRFNPAAFIDLHDVLRTRLLGLFLRVHGVPCSRIDKARGRRRALTRPRNKVMLPLPGSREAYARAFARAGLPLQERFEGLWSGRDKAPAEAFAAITAPKPEGTRWVGIAPFAAHAGKIYPPELMEQVVEALSQQPDVEIFLLGGGAEEARVLDGWATRYPRVRSLAGQRHGFAAELALFNHLDCMVTMDSANMHLAAIAGTPTLSIWGATHPYCGFAGWRQSDSDMIQLPVPCRPCSVFGDKPCRGQNLQCLRAIRPDSIVARVLQKIQSPANI